MMRAHLTRPHPCGDTGRSLKNRQHPGTLAASRVFCTPHSASRASARPARSMGVSGIRKDPDALMCVESTPTPFRVVLNLKKIGGYMPEATNTKDAGTRRLTRFTTFACNRNDYLFAVNGGMGAATALEEAACFLSTATESIRDMAMDLAECGGDDHRAWAALYLCEISCAVVEASIGAIKHEDRSPAVAVDNSRYEALLQRLHGLFDERALVLSPKAEKPAVDDARQFISWVTEQVSGVSA